MTYILLLFLKKAHTVDSRVGIMRMQFRVASMILDLRGSGRDVLLLLGQIKEKYGRAIQRREMFHFLKIFSSVVDVERMKL